MSIEILVCYRCGKLRQIYDRRLVVCFACYFSLSPYSKKHRRIADEKEAISIADGHVFDVRI